MSNRNQNASRADMATTDGMAQVVLNATTQVLPTPADAPAPQRPELRPAGKRKTSTGFSMSAMQGPDPYHAIRIDIARNGGRRSEPPEGWVRPEPVAERFTYGRGRTAAPPPPAAAAPLEWPADAFDDTPRHPTAPNEESRSNPMPQITVGTKATVFALEFPDRTAYIGRTTSLAGRSVATRALWTECPDPALLVLMTGTDTGPETVEAWRIAARRAGVKVRHNPYDKKVATKDIVFHVKEMPGPGGERAKALAASLAWPAIDETTQRIKIIRKPGGAAPTQTTAPPEATPPTPAIEAVTPAAETPGIAEPAPTADVEAHEPVSRVTEVTDTPEIEVTADDENPARGADETAVGQGDDGATAPESSEREDAHQPAEAVAADVVTPSHDEADTDATAEPTTEAEKTTPEHAPNAPEPAEAGTAVTALAIVEPATAHEHAAAAPTHEPEAAPTAREAKPTAPHDAQAHANRLLDLARVGLTYNDRGVLTDAMNQLLRLRYAEQAGPAPAGEVRLTEQEADAVLDELERFELGRGMLVAMTRSRMVEQMADQLMARSEETQPVRRTGWRRLAAMAARKLGV